MLNTYRLPSITCLVFSLANFACHHRGTQASSGAGDELTPRWLAGVWERDRGHEGFFYPGDFYLYLYENGDGQYSSPGHEDDLVGTWDFHLGNKALPDFAGFEGDLNVAGFEDTIRVYPGCKLLYFLDNLYVSFANDVSDCPVQPEPLSPVERCLIGTFTSTTSNSTKTYKLESDRLFVETYQWEDIWTGGGAYTLTSTWRVEGNVIVLKHVDGTDEERVDVATLLESREGELDPSCDPEDWPGGQGVVCAEAGSYCDQGEICCGDTLCTNYGGELGTRCGATCSNHDDCQSKCCAPAPDNTEETVCSPSSSCGA